MSTQIQKEEFNIRVIPRFRPFLKSEVEGAGEEKPKCCAAFHKNGKNILLKYGVSDNTEYEYEFPSVLKTTSTQENVYEVVGPEIVDKLLEGFNCTLVGYGGISSGKTFTLFGSSQRINQWTEGVNKFDGYLPRFIRNAFDRIMNSPESIEFSVSLSCYEVCGLDDGVDTLLNDLLVNDPTTSNLEVLIEEETNAVEVSGLVDVYVTSDSELFVHLSSALTKRAKKHSTIFVEIKFAQTEVESKKTKEGRLTLIDLDSERPNDTHKDIRQDGCKVFKQISEALHGEVEDFEYFSTSLRCLLFSRIFINTFSTVIFTMSPSVAAVEAYTLPNLNLAAKVSELTSEAAINYVEIEQQKEEEEVQEEEEVIQKNEANNKAEEVEEEKSSNNNKEEDDSDLSDLSDSDEEKEEKEEKEELVSTTKVEQEEEEKEETKEPEIEPKVEPKEEKKVVTPRKVEEDEDNTKKKRGVQFNETIEEQSTVTTNRPTLNLQSTSTITYNREIETLREKISFYQEQIENEERNKEEIEKKCILIERQLKDIQQELEQYKSLLNLEKSSVEHALKEKEKMEKNWNESQNEIQQLKEQLIQLESNKVELSEKVNDFEQNNSILEEQLITLKKEVSTLKEQLANTSTSSSTTTSTTVSSESNNTTNVMTESLQKQVDNIVKKNEETYLEQIKLLKQQFTELKQINTDLTQRVEELEKKNLTLEEENDKLINGKNTVDNTTQQLIERFKNKNKVLLEQLNGAKRDLLKNKETKVDGVLKPLEIKMNELQQAKQQFLQSIGNQSITTSVTTGNVIDSKDKVLLQKLKEKVTDLTDKLNKSRQKTTEMEISRMKWQESEKVNKQKITTLEQDIEDLKNKLSQKELFSKEELLRLQKECQELRENEQKQRIEFKKLEKEKEELDLTLKKETKTRKKSLMIIQQVSENNNLLLKKELQQAYEQIDLLQKEIKKQTGSQPKQSLIYRKSLAITQQSFHNSDEVVDQRKLDSLQFRKEQELINEQQQKQKLKILQPYAYQDNDNEKLIVIINKLYAGNVTSNNNNDVNEQMMEHNTRATITEEEYEMSKIKVRSNTEFDLQRIPNSSSNSLNGLKQGYLYKKGPKVNVYKKRWFKIEENNQLVYYNDIKDNKPLGSIEINKNLGVSVEDAPEKCSTKRKYVFKLETKEKVYYLSAPSKEEKDEWIKALENLLNFVK
ncbi:hypothetical protein ABK040_005267 [Willaertia magna]